MEILLLVLGISFAVFFITIGVSSVIKRDSKVKFYFIGAIISFIIAFIGFWKIPTNTDSNASNKNNILMPQTQQSAATSIESTDTKAVNSVIENNPLNVSFINNGLNGAILIQFNKKNILIDCGKIDNIQDIENSLKGHSVKVLDSIILTTTDSDSIGSAAQLIKDYKIKDIRYIDNSVKNNKSFKDIQAVAKANNVVIKKIASSYNIDSAIVSTSNITKGVKINFKFPEDQYDSSIQTMSFVKDSFKTGDNQSLRHDVNTNCDSLGNIIVAISTYQN
ncbi:hypothetical protein [Clostridium pasteurianum]|nr:hypothetical protein [Clostridium pasteurianum]